MEEEIEEWKDIIGFEGMYAISSFGRMKSFIKHSKGVILSIKNKTGWYLGTVLKTSSKKESYKIHILVAKYFIPNPENKSQVNHKDGNKQNNHKNNLEWNTPLENLKHSVLYNRDILKNVNHINENKFKIMLQLDLNDNLIEEHESGIIASIKTGICQRSIYQVAGQKFYKKKYLRKTAGGFKWRYKE